MTDPEAWEHFTEQAAIVEYDGGLSRADAEALALAETRDRWPGETEPELAITSADG